MPISRPGDFAQTLRCGTGALQAALNAVKGGTVGSMLVSAADTRLAYPKSDMEQDFGDAAAAALVGSGKENLVAVFEGSYSICNEMMDVWRNPEGPFREDLGKPLHHDGRIFEAAWTGHFRDHEKIQPEGAGYPESDYPDAG